MVSSTSDREPLISSAFSLYSSGKDDSELLRTKTGFGYGHGQSKLKTFSNVFRPMTIASMLSMKSFQPKYVK